MQPTIVTLSPRGDSSVDTVTFEQAFGDFSDFRGRGRARRQKRKMERIRNRRERRASRQEGRKEQQEARQSRKDTRKSRRNARKSSGEEEESEEQSSSQEEGSGDSAPDNQGEGQGEYETTQDGDVEAGQQEEQGESDEESGFTGDLNFDGGIELSPDDIQWNEYFSSVEGKKKINPKVKELARKIEQHKEYIKRIENSLQRQIMSNADKSKLEQIRKTLIYYRKRLALLERKLASYSKFDGADYSEARGGRSGVSRRKAEVRHAKHEARKERRQAKHDARSNREDGGDEIGDNSNNAETPVENRLNPRFGRNRIEVPEEETGSFDGTGLIGLDNQSDIDAPQTRRFDLNFSNAEGNKPKIDIKSIVIGVAIGVVAIYLIKKYGKK